jgi:hypothetical protein
MQSNFTSLFHSKDEEFIAMIGKGYLSSIIAGDDFSKTAVILSNKRIYQTGKIFEFNSENNALEITSGKKVINIEDVSGTSYRTLTYPALLYIGIFLLVFCLVMAFGVFKDADDAFKIITFCVGLVLAILFTVMYAIKSEQYFLIEYNGGTMGIPTKFYNEAELNEFQQIISAEKDSIKSGFKEYKECPFCSEKIKIKAIICRYCGREQEK